MLEQGEGDPEDSWQVRQQEVQLAGCSTQSFNPGSFEQCTGLWGSGMHLLLFGPLQNVSGLNFQLQSGPGSIAGVRKQLVPGGTSVLWTGQEGL